ncbi:MAG: site-specific integrase [Phocaeicola sp.]|nr:site-specific integrase [Phocaeicola sp.]
MKAIFRVALYLRSNYQNKEGKSSIMIRAYLNNERISLGSSGLFVQADQWDSERGRLKGRSMEALSTNLQLDNIQSALQNIFRRLEMTDYLSLERIKSEYLGKQEEIDTLVSLFNKHSDNTKKQIGVSIKKAAYEKYEVCKRHFLTFIQKQFGRSDLKLSELTPLVIHDFELYLRSELHLMPNSATKTMKLLKTICLFALRQGLIHHDPFLGLKLKMKPVDRGFLTDEEIMSISCREFTIKRLEVVRDLFLFSCFTGLAYIDLHSLTYDNIVCLNGQDWLITRRQKTSVSTSILLLDIPKAIIEKYRKVEKTLGKVFPSLSNQKMNAYLKEIADLCGIKKNLTFHLARHTFATMSLSKGVPMESVSKMLGHTNIKTTQIYARAPRMVA